METNEKKTTEESNLKFYRLGDDLGKFWPEQMRDLEAERNALKEENEKLREACERVMKLNAGMARAMENYKFAAVNNRANYEHIQQQRDALLVEIREARAKFEKKKRKLAKLKKKIIEQQTK